jgi:hypothetical protein
VRPRARYPNDRKLRYELGCSTSSTGITGGGGGGGGGGADRGQFQLSQRSPKERIEALFYLAMCFEARVQRDMAIMQLETPTNS